MFSCKFCDIFKSIFFIKHFSLTASDIQMKVVVIYNLNLSLLFVTINCTLCFHADPCTAWKVSKCGDFSGLHFPAFGLNTENILNTEYFVSLLFSPNAGKYRPEITPYLDIFHAVMLQCRLNYCMNLFFGTITFSHTLQDSSYSKIITKHIIKKTHIHIFHNRLLGEDAIIPQLFLTFIDLIRIVLESTF